MSCVPSRGVDRAAYTALGFPVIGPRAVRAEVLHRVLEHAEADRGGEPLDEAKLATWVGAPRQELRRMLAAALGAGVP